ncbi:DUF6079 family protein [Candidatus Marithrix sp. Canyon 246]|uniref:DUF6079 family protein n=1 Tax=Candidatus Marithrix sp. Canyon 246 TaxID=1827136 RepID=UPI00403DE128
MQYKNLFQFNSIESVIQLQAANQVKQLVASYVIFMQIIRLVKLVFVNDVKRQLKLLLGNF